MTCIIVPETINKGLEKLVEEQMEEIQDRTLGSDFVLKIPICKVDQEKREVTGIATGEIVDSHGEILTYEGSKEALKNWAGNVREMHQPKAVGRKVSMEFDDANKTITVKSRVSKGAEDTWLKVLDQTLSAYSVGGTRIDSEMKSREEVPPAALKGVTDIPDRILVTTKWKMGELSLVDAGANPLSAISLVKVTDGILVETEVLTEQPEAAQVEKAPLQAKERKALPKSSFAFVDKDGVGHYPIKGADGKCDSAQVRDALSKASAAVEAGGAGAELAKKALPKIRACAQKLRMGKFRDNPVEQSYFYNIRKIRLEDGTVYSSETTLDRDICIMASEAMKYGGGYAMEYVAEPVDFATAYQRYEADEATGLVYDILQILNSCLCVIAFDLDLSDSQKKKLVAESVSQFVEVFVGAASDAAATKVDLEGDLKKLVEETLIMSVEKTATPGITEEAMAAMLKSALGPEALGKVVATSIAPIVEKQDAMEKSINATLADFGKRIAVVEAAPNLVNPPALKVQERNGASSNFIGKRTVPANEAGSAISSRINEANEIVLTENGVEYTLAGVMGKIEEIEEALTKMPPNDPARLRNEVKAIALHRIRKILSGDKVWR